MILGWGQYTGTLKRAIAQFKYHHQTTLAEPLGLGLGEAWLAYQQTLPQTARSRPTVIPIPMHAEKERERGFNQAVLLAEQFCRRTRLPLLRDGLVRSRATLPQFSLSAQARQQNLAAAFELGPELERRRIPREGSKPLSVLLLDDIYTTGATIRAAAQPLREWGIAIAGVVAVALPITLRNPQRNQHTLSTAPPQDEGEALRQSQTQAPGPVR